MESNNHVGRPLLSPGASWVDVASSADGRDLPVVRVHDELRLADAVRLRDTRGSVGRPRIAQAYQPYRVPLPVDVVEGALDAQREGRTSTDSDRVESEAVRAELWEGTALQHPMLQMRKDK